MGLRKDLIEAVEAEEPATEDETGRIKDLIPRSAADATIVFEGVGQAMKRAAAVCRSM